MYWNLVKCIIYGELNCLLMVIGYLVFLESIFDMWMI